jgi:hypothetical protein
VPCESKARVSTLPHEEHLVHCCTDLSVLAAKLSTQSLRGSRKRARARSTDTTMAGVTKEAQRAELHKTIWRIANARVFVEMAFRDGSIQTTLTAIAKVLPPASRFSAKGGHGEKKERVLEKLGAFFERFFGRSSGGSN